MKNFQYLIIGLSLLVLGCNKQDLPEPQIGSPVFTADLLLDGEPLSLQAGVDGYYQYTYFFQGIDEVYVFGGELRPEDDSCTNLCPPRLEIIFRDQAITSGAVPDADLLLQPGSFEYVDTLDVIMLEVYDTNTFYRYELAADPATLPGAYLATWEFEGIPSSHEGPETTLEIPAAQNPPAATLTVQDFTFGDTCYAQQTQQLLPPGETSCAVSIRPEQVDSNVYLLHAEVEANSPYLFEWNDGSSDSVKTVFNSLAGFHEVIFSELNSQCSSTASLFSEFDLFTVNSNTCRASFSSMATAFEKVDTTVVLIPGGLHLGRVLVKYTAPNGEVYRSNRQVQPAESNFSILSVSDFDSNENGSPTKKLDLQFNCLLWNEAGEVRVLSPGTKATWGVAYPGG